MTEIETIRFCLQAFVYGLMIGAIAGLLLSASS